MKYYVFRQPQGGRKNTECCDGICNFSVFRRPTRNGLIVPRSNTDWIWDRSVWNLTSTHPIKNRKNRQPLSRMSSNVSPSYLDSIIVSCLQSTTPGVIKMSALSESPPVTECIDEIPKADEDKPKSTSVIGSLSFVDRYLSLWIISVMVIGVVVGYYSPVTKEGLAQIDGAFSYRVI